VTASDRGGCLDLAAAFLDVVCAFGTCQLDIWRRIQHSDNRETKQWNPAREWRTINEPGGVPHVAIGASARAARCVRREGHHAELKRSNNYASLGGFHVLKWVRVCVMLLVPVAASADLADELESYVGYTIVAVKTIASYVDERKARKTTSRDAITDEKSSSRTAPTSRAPHTATSTRTDQRL
jgi:hypothetical protein